MPSHPELIALLVEVASQAPTSMDEVDRLEARLGAWPDAPGFDDFEEAVVSYRPGGGEPSLLDEAGIEFAARQFLHELGHHRACAHG